MAILRALAAAVGFTVFAVLVVRAAAIAVVLPRLVWQLLRQSGCASGLQMLAALALLAGVAYLFQWERSMFRADAS